MEVHLTKQQLLLEGAQAYLNVLKANEKLQYAFRSEESIKKQTGIEESLVERGAGLSSDVLQAKQQLAGARALLDTAEVYFNLAVAQDSTFIEPLVNLGSIWADRAETISNRLREELAGFRGKVAQDDDVTFVVARIE